MSWQRFLVSYLVSLDAPVETLDYATNPELEIIGHGDDQISQGQDLKDATIC